MTQYVFRFGIKLDALVINDLFEWVPDQCFVLVMLDPDRIRPVLASIVWLGQKSSHNVLGPLQPLKANDRNRRGLWPTFFDAAPRKLINLHPRNCVLLRFYAALEREIVPGIGVLFVKQVRVQPTHDAPNLAAKPDYLLALP